MAGDGLLGMRHGFVRGVRLERETVADWEGFPFAIPAVRGLDELDFSPTVTFFVGENGSGKSTLLEAVAQLAGFNPEGGSRNFSFSTRPEGSQLAKHMRIVRSAWRERTGFFLRAESFFNAATYVDEVGAQPGLPPLIASYGGTSLHEMSHGESFLALIENRFGPRGLYILDEPEAALSPSRQLTVMRLMHQLIEGGNSQFIIATHSPILLAYPGARIYSFGSHGMEELAYEDTEHYQITKDFLTSPDRFFKHLFGQGD